MRVTEIFTPNDYPTHTYVERTQVALSARLREALMTPGEIVSVSGPSKSGKTVLIETAVGRDNLIPVTGAVIEDAAEVWDKALDWMEAPQSQTTTRTSTTGGSVKAGGEARAGIPLLADARGKAEIEGNHQRASGTAEVRGRGGMGQVIREIAKSDYVLLIDDFHYMPRTVQTEVAKQIKEAARQGVKICTASVPHRSDDVVRSNPDLRGRVRAIDTTPWSVTELTQIAQKGFPLAGITATDKQVLRIAEESFGSPLLMQAICLQLCFLQGPIEADPRANFTLSDQLLLRALQEVSTRTDHSSLVRTMHAGAKTRGQPRNDYTLVDGSRGDVYRALLLALKQDPPRLTFDWNELSRRVAQICTDGTVGAGSLSTACRIISTKGVLDFEGDPANRLTIEDPYLLFYLRWSDKLAELAR